MSFFWFVFLDKQKNEHKKLRIYEEIAQPHLDFTKETFSYRNERADNEIKKLDAKADKQL